MALVRPFGTSWVDAGLARRGLSLIGNVDQNVGLNVPTSTSTNEEVLFTSNLPAGLLNENGKGLRIEAWLSTVNNANSKRARIRIPDINGTAVVDTGLVGVSIANNGVLLVAYIFRVNTNQQDVFGYDMSNVGAGGTIYAPFTLRSKDQIQFVITGKNGASSAGDLVLRSVAVTLLTEGAVMTTGGVLQ